MTTERFILAFEVDVHVNRQHQRACLRVAEAETLVSIEDARAVMAFRQPLTIEEFLSRVATSPEERNRWKDLVTRLTTLRILVSFGAVVPSGKKAVVCRVNGDCSQLFLVFTGKIGGMGLRNRADAVEFVGQAGLLDRNFILFRDFSQSRYLHGISTDIPSFQSLLGWIRAFRDSLPRITSLYTTGNSMGAGTAIIAGHHLKADAVFAFSPGWTRFPQGMKESPGEGWDIPELLKNHNGVTRYHIFYATLYPPDCEAAFKFKGLPGVELHPVVVEGHNALAGTLEAGKLKAVFPQLEAVR